MEQFYFPIFLIVVAVFVVWIFRKAQSERSRRNRRSTRKSNTSQSAGHRSSVAWREPVGDQHKAKDVWHPKRERVFKGSFKSESEHGVIHAGYAGPYATSGGKLHTKAEIRDQDISEAEHLGIDEYLTKQEKEAAKAAAKQEEGLTMTAMKYEPVGSSSEEEEKTPEKKRAFKP